MKQLKIAYLIAITAYLMQFIILAISTFTSPSAQTDTAYQIFIGAALTLIKGIPWLALLPALIMRTKNAMAWMCYVCLLYFIIWMLAAFGENQNNLGTLGVIITLIQFCAAAFHTRMAKRI